MKAGEQRERNRMKGRRGEGRLGVAGKETHHARTHPLMEELVHSFTLLPSSPRENEHRIGVQLVGVSLHSWMCRFLPPADNGCCCCCSAAGTEGASVEGSLGGRGAWYLQCTHTMQPRDTQQSTTRDRARDSGEEEIRLMRASLKTHGHKEQHDGREPGAPRAGLGS